MHYKLFHFGRVEHTLKGSNSEWFRCTPIQAAWVIENELSRFMDVPSNEDGFDLSGIIAIPDHDSMLYIAGLWSYPTFIALFFDQQGYPLPFSTFRRWEDY